MSRLVLTVGCHRSGTSLIARSLQCFGVQLGEAAEWSGPDNPTGFWEHQGILAINEAVLRICSAHWSNPPEAERLKGLCKSVPDLVYLRGAAEHILRREMGRFPLFAIKDPRLSVLEPFWRPVLAATGDVSVIHVVRHPEAVATSLRRRNGMERDKALALWLRYVEAIRAGWNATTVDYDNMMVQPATELSRLGRRLGLDLDRQEATRFVTGFIDIGLRHEIEEGVPLPMEVSILWQQLSREATEP